MALCFTPCLTSAMTSCGDFGCCMQKNCDAGLFTAAWSMVDAMCSTFDHSSLNCGSSGSYGAYNPAVPSVTKGTGSKATTAKVVYTTGGGGYTGWNGGGVYAPGATASSGSGSGNGYVALKQTSGASSMVTVRKEGKAFGVMSVVGLGMGALLLTLL